MPVTRLEVTIAPASSALEREADESPFLILPFADAAPLVGMLDA